MVFKFTILIFAFSSAGLIVTQLIPIFLKRAERPLEKKVGRAARQLDTMFVHIERDTLVLMYALPPLILGGIGLILFRNLLLLFFGTVIGLILPTLVIKILQVRRKARFQKQLIDGVQVLSSSLKGGLSLLQAIEVLAEELRPPLSQEFGLVIRENKMGITLEESLSSLNARMSLEELELLVNSILVAKETGGDLTKVLSRLTTTIRDNQKLKENIKTLTLQGRLQAIIMSILPFIFVAVVYSFNKHHFDVMFETDMGRMLLLVAVALQIIGMFLIHKFSIIDI